MKLFRIFLILAICCLFMETKSQSLQEEENVATNAINSFSFDLYKKINKKGENLFYSPYSISTAIAMTYEGAKGNTEKEIKEVFYYPIKKDDFHSGNQKIANKINENSKYFNLSIANSLWAEKKFKFKKSYFNKIDKFYDTKLEYCNFKREPERCREKINNWVENQTNKKIQNLIPKSGIKNTTRLVLTNAIYFNAKWKEEFKKTGTSKGSFFVNEKYKVTTSFMRGRIKGKYLETKLFQLLEIQYQRNAASMLILLPKKGANLSEIEKHLSNKNYLAYLKEMNLEYIDVKLPKFQFSSNFKLSKQLEDLGMQRSFSGKADFSGITGKPNLKIDEIFHKAFVNVNEGGTEAAAATAVVMIEKTAVAPRVSKKFVADHPFVFFIKENQLNTILFAGKLCNPQK